MYHTYFYFSRLSAQLNGLLAGSRLMECFSQQKDEVVLRFFTASENDFYIKADLSQGNSLLTFPAEFARTRSNSADLFPELTGLLVEQVIQTPYDRSFHIRFVNGLQLCFKMYGGRSNLLLHNGNEILEVFNHHLKKDVTNEIPAGRMPEGLFEYHADPEVLRKRNPLFSKRMWEYWEKESRGASAPEAIETFRNMVRLALEGPMLLCQTGKEVFMSFLPIGTVLLESRDAVLISNTLSRYYWQVNRFHKQKDALVLQLEQRIFQSMQQLEQAEKQKTDLQEIRNYRKQADVLMAFGYQIEKGASFADLPDFSGEGTLHIPLKKDLSVVENAERYYRKAKGQVQDEERINMRIDRWKETLNSLKSELQTLLNVEGWPGLKPFLKQVEVLGKDTGLLPYHPHRFMDYEIWVGKNAKSNDEMLRLAQKDDLWLHARDVSGSHVIIKVKKGKPTPQPVLTRAAEWAAYYSKARNETLSPVMVTERKYVRKGKNMLPGQVRVEKEKTVLVTPRE